MSATDLGEPDLPTGFVTMGAYRSGASFYQYFRFRGVPFAIRVSDHPMGMSAKPMPKGAPLFTFEAGTDPEAIRSHIERHITEVEERWRPRLLAPAQVEALMQEQARLKARVEESILSYARSRGVGRKRARRESVGELEPLRSRLTRIQTLLRWGDEARVRLAEIAESP